MFRGKANVSGWGYGLGRVRVSATCIMLSPMGHVNDGGESRLRRGLTGAAAAFGGGGGVGRCVGGDLLWRAERVRAIVRDVCQARVPGGSAADGRQFASKKEKEGGRGGKELSRALLATH